MGANAAAGVPVQYGRPSVASPGFWLWRVMDIHCYTCGAVSIKCKIMAVSQCPIAGDATADFGG